MTNQELADLFRGIVEKTERVYALEPSLKGRQVKLLPPAADEHIRMMAKATPAPIPDSYAQFLRLHDGCLGFWEALTLLGTKGRPRKLITERIVQAVQAQGPEVLLAASSSVVTPEAIATYEGQGGDTFYVPAYLVFGTGGTADGGRCLLFNHKKKNAQGEPEVVDYGLDAKVLGRHASFEAFLRATDEALARRLKAS
jgi:hypothetical protein